MDACLWVGVFESRARFDEYVQERYFEDEREAPLNDFARDQGQDWYDHDWFEFHHGWSDGETEGSVDALLTRASFRDDRLEAASAAAANAPDGANTVIVCATPDSDHATIRDPRDCAGDGYQLVYLGRFAWL